MSIPRGIFKVSDGVRFLATAVRLSARDKAVRSSSRNRSSLHFEQNP